MKQILLRVPDQLHRRLAEMAELHDRSVNSLATEILGAALTSDRVDRRARLRARATALGALAPTSASPPPEPISAERREEILDSMRGAGPILDELLAWERDR